MIIQNMIDSAIRRSSLAAHDLDPIGSDLVRRWWDGAGKEVRCDVAGVAVPSTAHNIEFDLDADAIFLVEKECIFRRLLDGGSCICSSSRCTHALCALSHNNQNHDSPFHTLRPITADGFVLNQYQGRAVLITGCGYPDVQTRVLLRRISEMTDVPIYGIADWDPHG